VEQQHALLLQDLLARKRARVCVCVRAGRQGVCCVRVVVRDCRQGGVAPCEGRHAHQALTPRHHSRITPHNTCTYPTQQRTHTTRDAPLG
jgi:hypothetical protein